MKRLTEVAVKRRLWKLAIIGYVAVQLFVLSRHNWEVHAFTEDFLEAGYWGFLLIGGLLVSVCASAFVMSLVLGMVAIAYGVFAFAFNVVLPNKERRKAAIEMITMGIDMLGSPRRYLDIID